MGYSETTVLALLNPDPNKNRANAVLLLKLSAYRNNLVNVIAESIDTATPIKNVRANPLMSDVPNRYKRIAVIMLEVFESRIAYHARAKPVWTASIIDRPWRNSSLMRSNMRTLASTAIPIDMMKPAMPAAVNVTEKSLKRVRIMTT